VKIPADVQFHIEGAMVSKENANASYLSLNQLFADDIINWKDIYSPANGKINVWFRESVFKSDEEIVALFIHELYEIQHLRSAFAESGGKLNARTVGELINEGHAGNLHDKAWDAADAAVELMRSTGKK
jgi:hypothetical protein